MSTQEGTQVPASPSATRRQKQGKQPRKSSSLPAETVEYLKAWMMSPEHIAHPYPTEQEKAQIMADTGIELKQLTNWFVNNRKRFWKPRVEARLQQQSQVADTGSAASSVIHRVPSTESISALQSSSAPFISLDMTQPNPSMVTPQSSKTLAQFVESGKPRAVSITSSSNSVTDSENSSLSNDSEEDLTNEVIDEINNVDGIIKRTENIDVHILRPTSGEQLPALEDVSILPHIPSNRILRTYKSCTMVYCFPKNELYAKKKIQSKRDAEVVRIKKQYLKKVLQEMTSSTVTTTVHSSKKRLRVDEGEILETPRPKYKRKCLTLWRDACRTADHAYDFEIPSLEEASHLFGYAS